MRLRATVFLDAREAAIVVFMASLSDIFSRRAGDFMTGPPPTALATDGCATLIDRLDEQSGVVVIDLDGRPVGIVTEHDIARRIAFAVTPETPVSEIMSAPAATVDADEYVYHAIGRMRRLGLRHLPVTGADGRLVGMLDLDDALAIISQQRVARIDRLTHEGDLAGMKAIKAAEVEVAEELLADGLAVPEILALISHVNNDIHSRLTEAALAALRDETGEDPPVPFAVIVMGSAGRGESLLAPDQDNGFIIADYPDADHDRIDAFFIRLAERLTGDLAAAGFELCKGSVMATNPVWRKTLSQWRAQTGLWSRRQSHAAILLADIFFDFAPVAGEMDLAASLRTHVTKIMRESHAFLRAMEEAVEDQGTSLGLFGRIRRERSGAHKGRVNLKHAGALPLVGSLRLLALRAGIETTSTLARAEALRAAGVLDDDAHAELAAAFRHITTLMLRQQIEDFRAKVDVSNFVAVARLRRIDRSRLVDGLRAIEALRDRVHADFTGDIF